MNIDIIFSANLVTPEKLKNKNAVVIDVLRATSVIVTALNNKVNKINVFASAEEVLEESKNNSNAILCGERKGIKINNFDYGNSPLEYKNNKNIIGKEMYMTTSNGTRALVNSEPADSIFIASFLNLRAVVEKMILEDKDTVIVCSGTDDEFSLDDSICGGMIIDLLANLSPSKNITFSDSALAMGSLIKLNKDKKISEILKGSKHYSYLEKIGFKEDLEICLSLDIYDKVPYYRNHVIEL